MRPISPLDISGDQRSTDLPDRVIEVWNRLIAQNHNGTMSTVLQVDAVAAMRDLVPPDFPRSAAAFMIEQGWLDIEPVYRAQGWEVTYHKPAAEEHPARFTFYGSARKKHEEGR
jgi:hypothetical protein